jgi:hypothetical protein
VSQDTSEVVAEPLAKQSITEALHRYCVAVDLIDEHTWWQVWHHDATANYEEMFEGTASDLMTWIFEAHRGCERTSHQLANVLITIEGTSATSESYLTACVRANGSDVVVRGRYFDSWASKDGGSTWRIEERRYRGDLLHTVPVVSAEPRVPG